MDNRDVGYAYRAIWEITDPDRPRAALIADACAHLDTMASQDGAQLVGTPQWTIAGDRLVCDVPARPLGLSWPGRSGRTIDLVRVERALGGQQVRLTPEELDVAISRLLTHRLTAQEIGQRLHRSRRTIQRRIAASRTTTQEAS